MNPATNCYWESKMKLDHVRFPCEAFETSETNGFDLLVVASGFESRSRSFMTRNKHISSERSIFLGFSDRVLHSREDNDAYFRRLNFEERTEDQGSLHAIFSIVKEVIDSSTRPHLRILVDYSCMTRSWYGGLLSLLTRYKSPMRTVDIYFVYTPPVYRQPEPYSPNESIEPVPGFCSLGMPDRDLAVVVGVGYEPDRAIGLVEYLEPSDTWVFYSDPPIDDRYLPMLQHSNESLFSWVEEDHLVPYPMPNLSATYSLLSGLVNRLADSKRVVIAPLGPKPFALISFLVAMTIPGIDVWRVTAGTSGDSVDREGIDRTLTTVVHFTSND